MDPSILQIRSCRKKLKMEDENENLSTPPALRGALTQVI